MYVVIAQNWDLRIILNLERIILILEQHSQGLSSSEPSSPITAGGVADGAAALSLYFFTTSVKNKLLCQQLRFCVVEAAEHKSHSNPFLTLMESFIGRLFKLQLSCQVLARLFDYLLRV